MYPWKPTFRLSQKIFKPAGHWSIVFIDGNVPFAGSRLCYWAELLDALVCSHISLFVSVKQLQCSISKVSAKISLVVWTSIILATVNTGPSSPSKRFPFLTIVEKKSSYQSFPMTRHMRRYRALICRILWQMPAETAQQIGVENTQTSRQLTILNATTHRHLQGMFQTICSYILSWGKL